MARYDLTDFEWRVIEPLLTIKPRGVPRVDDRRVLSGIFWILRSGSPWRDLPERYGPYTTVYNRFNRWRKAGVWDKLMDASSSPRSRQGFPARVLRKIAEKIGQLRDQTAGSWHPGG